MDFHKRLSRLEATLPEPHVQLQMIEDLARQFPSEREGGPFGPVTAITVEGRRFEVRGGVITPALA